MAKTILGAGTVVKVDDVVVAKITQFSRDVRANEVNVTGSEDTTGAGNLVRQQFDTVSISETLSLGGIAIGGTAARLEPGQSALNAAVEAGSEIEIEAVDKFGYGHEFTGKLTGYTESMSNVEDVWKWTANFRVNSKAAVTP